MEMPEGWKTVFEGEPTVHEVFKAGNLMKEMAEALEYFRLQALESEHPCKDKNLACWHILNNFKSWK